MSVKSLESENLYTNMHHLHVRNKLNVEFWQYASITDKFLRVVKSISHFAMTLYQITPNDLQTEMPLVDKNNLYRNIPESSNDQNSLKTVL